MYAFHIHHEYFVISWCVLTTQPRTFHELEDRKETFWRKSSSLSWTRNMIGNSRWSNTASRTKRGEPNLWTHFGKRVRMLACSIRCFEHLVVSNRSGLFSFSLSISDRANILRNRFLGWHQKNGGKLWHPTFVGPNLPTTNFGWAESLSLGTFWTSRMGPDLDDAKVS